jgi:DNA polymerase III delta prime subunit
MDMQQAHSQIQQFIQKFQIQRTQAMTRMAERQRRMIMPTKKHTRKSKPKRRQNEEDDDDDDWLWGDNSDDDDDRSTSHRLCVWTGPVGCGKSAGIHAMARSQNCRILEIHTGQKRGITAIKRCIEEATQSHSLSMDKQKQIPKQTRNKKQPPLFFQKPSSRVLVDTDSDDEQEGQRQQPSSPETGEAAAITVILIDEVDNMYHEHGDSGFWTALNELYKKSKCPIILTANTLPSKLEANSTNTNSSTAFRFVHVHSELPTPSECAERLWTIIHAEGFRFRDNDRNQQQQQLEKIAILANCDMRRLVHQLQIMSLPVESDIVSQPRKTELIPNSKQCDVQTESVVSLECTNLPRIETVQPHAVSVAEYSLLTIHGSKFLSLASTPLPPVDTKGEIGYPCEVYVGDQLCPRAVILDDATILAVTAPLSTPNCVDITTGKYHQDSRSYKSWMAEYATLTVNSIPKQGIISSTYRAMTTVEVPDGTCVTMLVTPCHMEIHFPGHISIVQAGGSIEEPNEYSENEFEPHRQPPPTTSLSSSSSSANYISQDGSFFNRPLDSELVSKLFQKGIEDWCSRNGVEKIPKPTVSVPCEIPAAKTMERIAWDCKLLSDAALLEDIASFCTPYLSGSCRGYGYELTDEYPKYTNESTKP